MRSVDFKAIEASAREFHIWREQVHSTFCALFPNRLDTIVRTLDGTGWRAVSRFYSLSDEDIQESVSRNAKALRAVMAGVSTRFSVLTIAAGSELYSLAGLARIREALERVGIVKTSFYKASGSDDWQIYIWWTESVKAKELERLFSEWLVEVGLSAGHSLFVFPGLKPLPLPLQTGFAWLDERGAIKVGREELSLEQAVEAFLNDMATGANRWEVVSHQIKHITELETVERNVIDAWEPPIDRLMPDSNESSVRVIALIQPTCDNELLTFDTCVPATLQVSVPEVEYTVSFAPDQNEPKNRIAPDTSDDQGFDLPVYQRG